MVQGFRLIAADRADSIWGPGFTPKMRDSTEVIRSTLTEPRAGEPMHAGPVFAAPFHVPGDPAEVRYSYGRSGNPTWTALEGAIAAMESGSGAGSGCGSGSGPGSGVKALVFGSGMAACTAVFGSLLRPGDAVVMPAGGYFTARMLIEEYFAPIGIELRLAPTAGNAQEGCLAGAKLLWIESPSNPGMEICDIRALCDAAHRLGVLVAADNSTVTPLGQRVLELGADLSVVSDTKLMTGHSDLLLGHVATRDGDLHNLLERWRTMTGAVPGPMEAWLALRSIGTLPLRLERSSENALAIAQFLLTRPEVHRVLYPGVAGHPGHTIAAGQMQHFGPVLSFELRDQAAAEQFLASARLITEATSFGGITTTAERRGRWGHDAVAPGFIRMSAGCEAVEDLIDDMAQVLDQIG